MDGKTAARKKSEKRQRGKQIKVRCLADEFNEIAANAARSGLSVGAYLRAAGRNGDAGIRARAQLPVDAQLLRQVLAQHGKYGNNMNQIAYVLNRDGPRPGIETELRAALREWGEIRDMMLAALGREPQPKGPAAR